MARGPAYPFVDLREAVKLLDKLHSFAKRTPAAVEQVAKDAWGWSATSSTPKKASAALKYFGLVDEVRDGKAIKVSDRGYRILVDDADSPERKKAIRDAALSPAQYQYCYQTWGADLPPVAKSKLIFDRGFIASTVDGFLKDYKSSMDFAGLTGHPEDEQDAPDDDGNAAALGGITHPEHPAVVPPGAGVPPPPPARVALEGIAMRQDVFSIEEGVVTIQWPNALSKDSLQDIQDWLEIIKRKLARSLKEAPRDGDEGEG
jgi:hypothetical protein